jgi:hypothetical protein
MSVNKYKAHLMIIPEDDANRRLANGFVFGLSNDRHIQILSVAGGWANVLTIFHSEHVGELGRYPARHILMLLDFDDRVQQRLKEAEAIVPEQFRNRVFILGSLTEPEALKQAGLGSFEAIGRTLAAECLSQQHSMWNHDLLTHNKREIERLKVALPADFFH